MEDETFGCNYYTTPFKHHKHKYSGIHNSFFSFFYFYYTDFNNARLCKMGGKVVKNFEGYGVLIKAQTKFVHSGLHIFTDWEVWAEWWLVPMRYPSQCFGGEKRRNIFKIIE